MKNIKLLSWMFVALLTSVSLASCSDDDDPVADTATQVGDVSDIVSGVYSGKLEVGGYTIDDAYIVTITRVTSTAVKVKADFFNEDPVFNVEKVGTQYKLTNTSTYSNISMFVSGGVLNINFVNGAGSMTVYAGNR